MRPSLIFLLLLPLTACGLFAHKETRTLHKSSWRFSQRVVDILLNASSGLAEAMT